MAGKFYTGSICLSDLSELFKSNHSSFTKAKNGKNYCNVKIWVNETPNERGQHGSIQVNPKKDSKDKDAYIGNFELKSKNISEFGDNNKIEDDLPF